MSYNPSEEPHDPSAANAEVLPTGAKIAIETAAASDLQNLFGTGNLVLDTLDQTEK